MEKDWEAAESADVVRAISQYRKLADADTNRQRSLTAKLLTNLRLLDFDFETTAALFSTALDNTIFEQPHLRLLEEILYFFMSLIDREQCEQVLCGYWPPQSAEQHKYFRDTALEFLAPLQARNASLFPAELLSKRLLDAACGVGIVWLLLATSTHILFEICKEEFAVSGEELRSLYLLPDEHAYLREQRKQMLCERVNEWHEELLRLISQEAVEMQQVSEVAQVLERQYWEQQATVDVLKTQIAVFANSLFDPDSVHHACASARAAHAQRQCVSSESHVDMPINSDSLAQSQARPKTGTSSDNLQRSTSHENRLSTLMPGNTNEIGRKLQYALYSGLGDVLEGSTTAEDAIKLNPTKWGALETKLAAVCDSIAGCTSKIEKLKVDATRSIPRVPERIELEPISHANEFAQSDMKKATESTTNATSGRQKSAGRQQQSPSADTMDLADFLKHANEYTEKLIALNTPTRDFSLSDESTVPNRLLFEE